MESRTLNAKRNMLASLINRIVSMLLPFVTRTIFIYSLGSLYLGLNSIFSSVLSVLSLAELGVGTAMVYSMYKPIANGDAETVCALLNLYRKIYRIIGAVILVLGLAFTPFLPHIIKGAVPADINLYVLYFINLFSTVVSYFLFAYKNSLLTASQRMDVISHIDTGVYTLLSCWCCYYSKTTMPIVFWCRSAILSATSCVALLLIRYSRSIAAAGL